MVFSSMPNPGKGWKWSLIRITAYCIFSRILWSEKAKNQFVFIFRNCSQRRCWNTEIFRKFCHFRTILAIERNNDVRLFKY